MQEKQIIHAKRLASDYRSIEALANSIINCRPATPFDPASGKYPDKYIVTFNILAPTIEGDRRQHELEIDCSSMGYPTQNGPVVTFKSPRILHPHVYDYAKVCTGGFPLGESLAELCVRLARLIQFDPLLMSNSIASHPSHGWYQKNIKRFPMDKSVLPSLGFDQGFSVKTIRKKN